MALTCSTESVLRYLEGRLCEFPNLEELIILWTDAADPKSLDGRAENYIEGVPGHRNRNDRRYSAWTKAVSWRNSIVEAWEAGRWWDRFGR